MILQLRNQKQVNDRLEILLMIVPVFILILANLFIKSAELNTKYTNTYFSFSFGNVSIFSWTMLIIPFVLHLFLKQQQTSNKTINSFHILLSIALLISVQFTYELNVSSNVAENGSFWGLPFERQWMEATYNTYVLLVCQLLLQIIFCIYALIQLFPK
jgi:cell division protein FtsW (lipid II flippase)